MIHLTRSVSAQLSARICSRFGKVHDFFSAASEVIELCPSEMIEGRPVKTLSGQLERVTASPFGASVSAEIEVARGGARNVNATRMYIFENVTVAKRWVICGGRHEEFVWPRSEWAFSNPEYFAEAAFSDSVQGSRFFGHWLRDDCATNALFPTDLPLVRPSRQNWADEEFYTELFDLRETQQIDHGRIDRLTYIEDLANNRHKLLRLNRLRGCLRQKIRSDRSSDIVYVSRGPSARGRAISNEDDLICALRSRGVRIVIAEGLEPVLFLKEILDADLIISAEGSQCAHAIYALRDNAAGLITLQPHDRFYLPHLEWVRLFGLDFGLVVSNPDNGEFWIDPEEVLKTIDLF